MKRIKNLASALLIGALLLTSIKPAKANIVYLPVASVSTPIKHCNAMQYNSGCPHTTYMFTACIDQSHGCNPTAPIIVWNPDSSNEPEYKMVYPIDKTFFEDGSATIQIENVTFGACIYPLMGCTPENEIDIIPLQNGTVEFWFGI